MSEGDFERDRRDRIRRLAAATELHQMSVDWLREGSRYGYSYNFEWIGRPIIQFPQDVLAMQEIIWRVKPRLVIETGVAHGGALVFYASMLELIGGESLAIGIDVEIRPYNRRAIEAHPMARRLKLIEGSSIDEPVVATARDLARGREPVLVALDSNHTHSHVLREFQLYSPLVTRGSYLVVFNTIIEDLPAEFFPDRPWKPGNSPKSALREFLETNDRFEIDTDLEGKLLVSVAPGGYLRCIKD